MVDSHYVRQVFGTRFTHPSSRLIWYGAGEGNAGADAVVDASAGRVLVRPDRLPAERISQFSHMGVLFSDANPLYGRQGSLRLCLNGQEPAEYRRCVDGGEVWYSDWGYREPGKVHARLTYNPYFAWQTGVMLSVLGLDGSAAPAPGSAPATAAATASPAASSTASPTVAPIRSQ
ncbi:hypothetical protein [Cupriavidus gilardii]|uniref:hypothetical protein n=1 Tax=Cupriavidus gilardii TaxID=82541 RepID=UPI002011EFC2|nr:hypothetical protein [Cupriavidus gilardii]